MERRDGKPFDFRRKRGEHAGHVMMLPDGARMWVADPTQLWQRAEDAEHRGDAQVARMIEIAIPREVAANRRVDFVRSVATPWVADGMAAQIDIHCTHAADGKEQPHAHVILTMRRLDGDGFAKTKERAWNKAFIEDHGRAMRAQVAARMNLWLKANGISARVDHRTQAEQGITGPAPEKNAPRRAWAAHRAAPDSEAAVPVREVLAERQQRAERRRDIEWQQARAEYAAAAAMHYTAERDLRAAAYAERRQRMEAARSDLRRRQRGERDRTYQHTRRGIVRSIALAVQHGAHDRQRAALDVTQQAERMTGAAPGATFPAFDEWCELRAAEGDLVAKAALDQRASRRTWLAQKDPAGAATRTLNDVIRATDRVLRGRPCASVDDAALLAAARDKLAARHDQAAEAARTARLAAVEHWRGTGFWRRWTDAGWCQEHNRLTAAAQEARQGAYRLASRYDADVRVAREAARQAAAENRHGLAAWLARPDVRAAQSARYAADRVRTAVDAGDEDTIAAVVRGDLPAAAQAAKAAEEQRATDKRRQRKQQEAEQADERLAVTGRQAEAAQRARRTPPRLRVPQSTGMALAPALKPQ